MPFILKTSIVTVHGLCVRQLPCGQAVNSKELFKNNLYILLVFSPDNTRGKSLT